MIRALLSKAALRQKIDFSKRAQKVSEFYPRASRHLHPCVRGFVGADRCVRPATAWCEENMGRTHGATPPRFFPMTNDGEKRLSPESRKDITVRCRHGSRTALCSQYIDCFFGHFLKLCVLGMFLGPLKDCLSPGRVPDHSSGINHVALNRR